MRHRHARALVGRCIVDEGIADIKFLRRVVRRDSDDLEEVLATDDGMCPLGGDIKGGDGKTGLVGHGLRFPGPNDVTGINFTASTNWR